MYRIRKGEVVCFTLLLILCALYFLRSVRPLSRERAIWRAECELGVISDPECPIDGGWTSWSAWSACSGYCDDVGHRIASRRCTNPPPAKDGLPCDGPQEKIETCQISNCTVQDYRKLVEKDPIKTEAFQLLETFPALLERCLQMECLFEAIEAAVSTDNTWQINIESLWNALQCVKHNIGCRVIGDWCPWGAWSACGARCGPGLRWRIRLCNNPPPSDARHICHGTPLQSMECEGDQCEVNKDGEVRDVWGEWKQWSSCSESCGMGVTRRRRTCNEKPNPLTATNWGTHCQGQHDQLKICEKEHCVLNGSWSGWGSWSPCSQTCGPGIRTRTRSCSRPSPSGGGAPCLGPRTATASCHLIPCDVYPHTVAILNGESSLKYNFEHKRSSLFHIYIRFLPLSPHGTLVRRGSLHNSRVKLNLHKWRICLHANDFGSCGLPQICTPLTIEPAVWHTVLATVTNEGATLRLDDAPRPIRGTFECDPEFPNDKMDIVVGERLHGEIQEVILNFMPLSMVVQRDLQKQTDYIPTSASNIAYERAGLEEAYLPLDNNLYARLPCFDSENEWRIELTLKSKRDTGTILLLRDDKKNNWLHMKLQNMRIKLKLVSGDLVSCSSSSMEYPTDEWIDVMLHKKRDTNTIEATINMGDHLHVIVEDVTVRKRRELLDDSDPPLDNIVSSVKSSNDYFEGFSQDSEGQPIIYSLCSDEFFIGGVPMEIKNHLPEDFTTFYGIIASLSINGILQDLHKLSVERCTTDGVQVSSRTGSLSGLYRETAWGLSSQLNLSCLHARKLNPYQTAHWLFLDTEIYGKLNSKSVRSVDDGKVLKLVAAADNDLRGFYTCRAHTNKRTINIVTYGVMGKIQNKITSPDAITAIAVFTTLTIVISTLAWLFLEGIDDLRNGFGFFRDRSLSPQEEAEEVCKYIDENSSYFKCKSDMRVAKARARSKARQLMSRMSFGAQEPEGLMEVQADDQFPTSEESSPELPALPEIRSCVIQTHEVYRCEPCYISSPRHGSIMTPRAKCTSSSSVNTCSPRAAKHPSSRDSSISRGKKSAFKPRSDLITIKSSTFVNRSPAQKILQKFQQLRSEDT